MRETLAARALAAKTFAAAAAYQAAGPAERAAMREAAVAAAKDAVHGTVLPKYDPQDVK